MPEVALVVVVIAIQLGFLVRTCRRAQALAEAFPNTTPVLELGPAVARKDGDQPAGAPSPRFSDGERPAPLLRPFGDVSPAFRQILDATNDYLGNIADDAPDFQILRDISHRVSIAADRSAGADVTMPLYVGLMGTFAGIILGLLGIVQQEGLPTSALEDFLGGVVVAMSASFFGLLLTVIGRQSVQRAKATKDEREDAYLTFVQADVLPVAGRPSTALLESESNLQRFNASLAANLDGFAHALTNVSSVVENQKDLLEALRNADLAKVIRANTRLLDKLGDMTTALNAFVAATQDLESRVTSATDVADKLHQLLDRIHGFEANLNRLGDRLASDGMETGSVVDLIQKQLDSIQGRTELITQYTDSQDEKIKAFMTGQNEKLNDLLQQSNQQVVQLSDQLNRSLSVAFGSSKATEVVDSIVVMPKIRGEVEKISAVIHARATSGADEEVVRLLRSLAERSQNGGGLRAGIAQAYQKARDRGAEAYRWIHARGANVWRRVRTRRSVADD